MTQVKPKSKTIVNYWAIRGLFSRETVLGARSGLAHGRLGLTGLFIRSAARAYRCLGSALNRPSFNADKYIEINCSSLVNCARIQICPLSDVLKKMIHEC